MLDISHPLFPIGINTPISIAIMELKCSDLDLVDGTMIDKG